MVTGHGGAVANRAVLIYSFDYPEDMPRGEKVPLRYQDKNFVRLFAWKQIKVIGLQGVEVVGHQPYQDLIPYDYTMLDLGGLLPSTQAVSVEIAVPNAPVLDAEPSESYAEALMRFGLPTAPKTELKMLKTFVIIVIPLTILVGISIVIKRRRESSETHKEF